jgi:hypothetical protein
MQEARELVILNVSLSSRSPDFGFKISYRDANAVERTQTMCLLQELGTDNVVAVESDFIAQEADAVVSPYGNGTYVIDGDMFADNAYLSPDVLADTYMAEGQHPAHLKEYWRFAVAQGQTEHGYWQWVSQKISEEDDASPAA